MAAAKDDPVSVEDNDNIESLLDSADRLSSTISRPFSGLSTVLARIRAASIAQKKELDATLEVCQQMQKNLDVTEAENKDKVKALTAQVEAFKADVPKLFSVKKEPTEVGDAVPRLASHANYPTKRLASHANYQTKRSRPSPSTSSGASSGAAGGAAGGAAEGVAGQGFSEICPVTKCLVSQCLHCWPLSDE